MANSTVELGFNYIYNEVLKNVIPEYFFLLADDIEYHPWLFAFLGSVLVGLSGIFPLLIIPVDDKRDFKTNESPFLKVILSFAVGALLGDVFLHLLPEAWLYAQKNSISDDHVSMRCGLWVLCGLLLFIIVEKIFAESHDEDSDDEAETNVQTQPEYPIKEKHLEIEDMHKLIQAEQSKREKLLANSAKISGAVLCDNEGEDELYESCLFNNDPKLSNGVACGMTVDGKDSCQGTITNGVVRGRCLKNRWIGRTIRKTQKESEAKNKKLEDGEKEKSKHIAGYLNLLANSIDNFTHGLAVGGSFLVSFRVGVLSTFAILVHEIPHEVGDFAILLRSGFSRWEAAKAQLATATGGLVGAMTAVIFSGASNTIEAKTSWILPFTAGGFLHIALITVLPDLLREQNPWESLKQLSALVLGIAVMGTLTAIVD